MTMEYSQVIQQAADMMIAGSCLVPVLAAGLLALIYAATLSNMK